MQSLKVFILILDTMFGYISVFDPFMEHDLFLLQFMVEKGNISTFLLFRTNDHCL